MIFKTHDLAGAIIGQIGKQHAITKNVLLMVHY